ncbi:unnamed protein product, partial [Staurois parvus]
HLKATPSLERALAIDSANSCATSAHCALQHALTPVPCHVSWPTTWWLSGCCSPQLLPLCYNPTNS